MLTYPIWNLFFTFRQPTQRSAVEEYFGRRPHYQLNGSAVYQSRDTGVYFLFEFRAGKDDPNQLVGASLNVNYFRPHNRPRNMHVSLMAQGKTEVL